MPSKPIPYPQEPSEFEIHAFLFFELKRLGYDARGEVNAKGSCFDLVVFDAEKQPIRIIEVKKTQAKKSDLPNANLRLQDRGRARTQLQLNRYDRFGILIDFVSGMKAAEKYIRMVEQRGGFVMFKGTTHK